MDNVITKKELCEYYNIPESTFDDVDFDLFMYYLDGNWELFHMVSSDHVINALEDFKALPNEDKTYEGITAIKESGYNYKEPDYRYDYLIKHVSDKTLLDERMDDLTVIMYANEGDIADVWILDFSRGLTFVSDDVKGLYYTESATGTLDETIRKDVIDRLKAMENSEWWLNGETIWTDEIDNNVIDGVGSIWMMYLGFSNGDVIRLSGDGREGCYGMIPDDLADFSHYIRLRAENNS